MSSCMFVGLSNKVLVSELEKSYQNAIRVGFNFVVHGKLKYHHNIWAGTAHERKETLENAFKSNVSCIWAYKGGSGTIHFVNDLNFSYLKKNPKLFLGYSDLTTILNNIYLKTGIISLHGPSGFKEIDEESLNYLKLALQMKDYSIAFKDYISYNKRSIKKVIMGGNLATISWNLGSASTIQMKNKIVFFEDIGTTDAIAYNRLVQLKLSNTLKPRAILFGYLQNIKDIDLFIRGVQELFPKVPIIYNLPIGHLKPNITIPIGATCKIDFEQKTISFKFPKKKNYRCTLS